MGRLCLLCLALWGAVLPLAGQADSLRRLAAVEITASRAAGPALLTPDSLTLRQYRSGSLGQLLGQEGYAFIKHYGPGRLATPSLRGAGAAHTAVLWNGWNLSSPMNGQLDFSLLPVSLLDQVRVQYGGQGALLGSGAVGGAIHLDSRPGGSAPGWSGHLQADGGAFGFAQLAGVLRGQGARGGLTLRAFGQRATHDFRYRVPLGGGRDSLRRQQHAAQRQAGFIQEGQLRLSDRQSLSLHLWYQQSEREIPPAADQTDRHLRSSLGWRYQGPTWDLHLRGAYFAEGLVYTDTVTGLDAPSQAQTVQGEAEWRWWPGQGQHLRLGLSHALGQARADGYGGLRHRREQGSFFALYRLPRWRPGWEVQLSLRQGWADGAWLPPMPGVAWSVALRPGLLLRGQAGRSFRLPTFNDLFWQPGGNAALRPEAGWSGDLGLEARHSWGRTSGDLALTGFTSRIDDWILWRPVGAYWAPENLRRVWARGLELRAGLARPAGSGRLRLGGQGRWQRSTNQAVYLPGDASLYQQLIYTPVWQGSLSLAWEHPRGALRYVHGVTSRRYIASDGSAFLPGYFLGQVLGEWQVRSGWTVFLQLQNAWNASYEVVKGFPMPLRHVQAGVRFEWEGEK